jgi:hypothetical protein
MRSAFFYHKNDTPVFQKGKVIARYKYRGGAFEQHAGKAPIDWTETKSRNGATFTYQESRRDTKYIFLYDSGRRFTIRLPVSGGRSSLSTDGEKTWRRLYKIAEPSFINHDQSNQQVERTD